MSWCESGAYWWVCVSDVIEKAGLSIDLMSYYLFHLCLVNAIFPSCEQNRGIFSRMFSIISKLS